MPEMLRLDKPHSYDEDPFSNSKPPLCRCGMGKGWWQHQAFWMRYLMRLTGKRWLET